MKIGFALLLGLAAVQLVAQEVNVSDSTRTEQQSPMLLGRSSRAVLQQDPFRTWFNEEYEAYAPAMAILDSLKAYAEGIEVEIYMGTWCSDSRREVPRIYKIADYLGLESDGFRLIGLDRDMASPDHDEEGMNIHHVPTVVFYLDGLELGRIIETPVGTLEEDMRAILKGDVYIPNYNELEE